MNLNNLDILFEWIGATSLVIGSFFCMEKYVKLYSYIDYKHVRSQWKWVVLLTNVDMTVLI